MDEGKKPLRVCLARIFIVPAAIGFLVLFGINFALVVMALTAVSVGVLCLPLGVLYLFGDIKLLNVVSDLSPASLAAAGAFMLCLGAFLCFSLCLFAPFSVRLLYRYSAAVGNRQWRRIYSNFSFSKFFKISLVFSIVSLGVFAVLRYMDIKQGYEGTVVKESLTFPNANYIYISTSGLDFEIKSYEGKEILVEYTNDMPIIVEESSSDYLKLTQDDSFTVSVFAKDQFSYKMTVWLPVRDYREFYLNSGSGNITMEETLSRFCKLRTRSGNIYISNAHKEINAESITGSIFCSYIAFTATGSFESKEGNITVLVPDFSGVDLQFRTESGWLDSSLMGLDERFYGSVDLKKPATLSKYLYVTTGSGGLTLEASNTEGE